MSTLVGQLIRQDSSFSSRKHANYRLISIVLSLIMSLSSRKFSLQPIRRSRSGCLILLLFSEKFSMNHPPCAEGTCCKSFSKLLNILLERFLEDSFRRSGNRHMLFRVFVKAHLRTIHSATHVSSASRPTSIARSFTGLISVTLSNSISIRCGHLYGSTD